MSFKTLKNYILKKMKMSHIYQPVMLKSLIENNGKNSSKEIAKDFLKYDPWAIKYYEDITKIMPGRILTKNLSIIKRNKNIYSIENYYKMNNSERKQISILCEKKIEEFIQKRGGKTREINNKSTLGQSCSAILTMETSPV